MKTQYQIFPLTHFVFAYVKTMIYIVCNTYIELDVYPGETFQVSVVAVGQRDGTVSSTVRSSIFFGDIPDSQYLQQANSTCTKLNYTVFSLSQFPIIYLYAEDRPCSN